MTSLARPPIFLIDGQPIGCLPDTIDVTPPGATEIKLAGGQRHYIEETHGVDIEAVFGINALLAHDLRALELARGMQSLHMLTFNNISCDEIVELLVHMPKIPHTRDARRGDDGDFTYSPTTITFHQVNTAFEIVQFDWYINEAAGWSTGTGKYRLAMPAAGRFINVPTTSITGGGISGMGFWHGHSGGNGSTVLTRLRNATQGLDIVDMTFTISVGNNNQMTSKTLPANLSFVKDDIIELNLVSFTGAAGTPATNTDLILVQALCKIHGPAAIS